MKHEISNLVKHLKKLHTKQEITPSSVGFQNIQSAVVLKPEKTPKDFFEELKEAISAGDDNIWRMWR